MVVCKFFLQGDCRFGDSCKFEHQYNDNRQQHSSIIRQQTFNPTNTNSPGAPVDTNTLVRSVSNDMITVEKSGQWLLSCYAPFKEKSLFPGFEDHSFEEIRYGYYNAKSSGSLDAYNQQLGLLLQEAMMKIKILQNPTPEAIAVLRKIFDEYVSPPPPNPIFGNTQANPYGATVQNPSIFTQPNPSNIFNNNQPSNQSAQSIFAAANQSLFRTAQPTVFNTNQNIFADSQVSNNPLGQQFQAGLQQVQPASFLNAPFASATQPQNNPLFTQTAPSVFNAPVGVSNSPLATQQPILQNALFSSSSPFSNVQNPAGPPVEVLFNSNAAGGGFNATPSGIIHDGIYSQLEELSENDVKSFLADAFEFGKIPEKPPHVSMC